MNILGFVNSIQVMKKIVVSHLLFFISFVMAAQCTIDPNSSGFISPRPDSLPCVTRGIYYEEVIQFSIPASINLGDIIPNLPFPYTLYIDSIVINGVNGLPSGLNYTSNPPDGAIRGGQRGCAQISGTTNDPAGNYPITFDGYMKVRGLPIPGFFDGDTTFDFSSMQGMGAGPQGFSLAVDVIEPGATCRGVSSANQFQTSIRDNFILFPNPSEGSFYVVLNTRKNTEVEINIIDITGKKVFTRQYPCDGYLKALIDVSSVPGGMYRVVLKLEEETVATNLMIH
jgi:hypothetical protein